MSITPSAESLELPKTRLLLVCFLSGAVIGPASVWLASRAFDVRLAGVRIFPLAFFLLLALIKPLDAFCKRLGAPPAPGAPGSPARAGYLGAALVGTTVAISLLPSTLFHLRSRYFLVFVFGMIGLGFLGYGFSPLLRRKHQER